MKKRSLFAAVAMLLVSALVLTSATFAWFAAGQATTVTTVTSKVQNNDGSLLVAAQNAQGFFKTEIGAADFVAANSGLLAADNVLTPVDAKIVGNNAPVWFGCTYDGFEFDASANGTGYLNYNWYIKSDKDGTINLVPSFTVGTGGAFVYGLVIVNNVNYIFGTSGDSYVPFNDSNVEATEGASGTMGIVDSNDTITAGALYNGTVSVQNPAAINIAATAGTVYTIQCYVWAEGQDDGCYGSVSNTGAGFSFAPTLTLPTP